MPAGSARGKRSSVTQPQEDDVVMDDAPVRRKTRSTSKTQPAGETASTPKATKATRRKRADTADSTEASNTSKRPKNTKAKETSAKNARALPPKHNTKDRYPPARILDSSDDEIVVPAAKTRATVQKVAKTPAVSKAAEDPSPEDSEKGSAGAESSENEDEQNSEEFEDSDESLKAVLKPGLSDKGQAKLDLERARFKDDVPVADNVEGRSKKVGAGRNVEDATMKTSLSSQRDRGPAPRPAEVKSLAPPSKSASRASSISSAPRSVRGLEEAPLPPETDDEGHNSSAAEDKDMDGRSGRESNRPGKEPSQPSHAPTALNAAQVSSLPDGYHQLVGGSKLKKSDQTKEVQLLLEDVVTNTYEVAFKQDPLLGRTKQEEFWPQVIIPAAQKFQYKEIENRVNNESSYRKKIWAYGVGRITNVRSLMKNIAIAKVVEECKLDSDKTKRAARVKFLLTRSPEFKYLFPDDKSGKPDENKPFLNEIITMVISEALGADANFRAIIPTFKRTSEGKRMMPAALAALGATAVHIALREHTSGTREEEKWEQKTFSSVWDDHMETLSNLKHRESTRETYPLLMAKLFQMAFEPKAAAKKPAEKRTTGVTKIVLD